MALYVRQLFVLHPLKNFLYLVGPEGEPEVAVVDPAWDVPALEAAAQEDGKRISAVVLTHSHNDHINGVPELLRRHDVPVYAHREEVARSAELRRLGEVVRKTSDGDEVRVGSARFSLLHTPGHTAGAQCLLCGDAVVTGDTLFVDHCGHCKSPGADPHQLYRSLTGVLARLPDATRVLPGHDYGPVKISTIAREKEKNPYLRFPDEAAFVEYRMRPR